MRRKQRAAQFLQHATFGPTQESIDELANRMLQVGVQRACSEWVDQQFQLPPTLHVDTINAMLADHGTTNTDPNTYLQRYRYHAWFHNALRAPDQLRQRVAWALSQIFVIGDIDGAFEGNDVNADGIPRWYGPSNFYDKLLVGTSGSYRQILEDVSLHPCMGQYLSHLRNAKADPDRNYYPDENYAREVMQLFSIGLHELHVDGRPRLDDQGNLIPTYDNETIKSMARVFTGLTLNNSNEYYYTTSMDFVNPMEMWEEFHDTDAKELPDGSVIPAHFGNEGDGMRDIHAALDVLADHQNVGPFIAKRLIQMLVHSSPSRAYIRRVSNAFNGRGTGVRGDMKAVIKAVLLDPEAWRGIRTVQQTQPFRLQIIERGTAYSKLQEPLLRYVQMIRALQKEAYYNDRPSKYYVTERLQWNLGQSPFASPSVFNFYLPEYQPPGPLTDTLGSRRLPDRRYLAPEFMLLTPVMNNRMMTHIKWTIYSGKAQFHHWSPDGNHHSSRIEFGYDEMLQMVESDPGALIDRLNLVLCRGTLDDETRAKLILSIDEVTQEAPWIASEHKLWATLYTIVSSPAFVVVQ